MRYHQTRHLAVTRMIAVALLSAGISAAQPAWTELTTAGSVPGRERPSAVYDPTTNRLIVYGGLSINSACCTTYNEVWVLSNANGLGGAPTWTQLAPIAPSGFPAPRSNQTAAYDPSTNRMIVFGGGQLGLCGVFCTLFNDTWILANANGQGGTPTWLPLAPTGGPPAPREGQSELYDAQNNLLIIFGGGNNGEDDMNDTWVLTNANGLGGTPAWTELAPGAAPSGRENFASGYDPTTNRMIIFGGCCYWTNDTWVLTNANGLGGTPQWQQQSPSGTLPSIRNTPAYGYDPTNNFLLIFGMQGPGIFYNDTWQLLNANGAMGTTQWVNLIPNGAPGSPPIISGFTTSSASGYDTVNQRLISLENTPVNGGAAVLQPWVLALEAPTTGTVQVTTNQSSASFTITGPTTFVGSGLSSTFPNAPPGNYTITFGAISGYATPSPQTQTLTAGATLSFTGTYQTCRVPNASVNDNYAYNVIAASYSGVACQWTLTVTNSKTYFWLNIEATPIGAVTITPADSISGFYSKLGILPPGASINYSVGFTDPDRSVKVVASLTGILNRAMLVNLLQVLIDASSAGTAITLSLRDAADIVQDANQMPDLENAVADFFHATCSNSTCTLSPEYSAGVVALAAFFENSTELDVFATLLVKIGGDTLEAAVVAALKEPGFFASALVEVINNIHTAFSQSTSGAIFLTAQ